MSDRVIPTPRAATRSEEALAEEKRSEREIPSSVPVPRLAAHSERTVSEGKMSDPDSGKSLSAEEQVERIKSLIAAQREDESKKAEEKKGASKPAGTTTEREWQRVGEAGQFLRQKAEELPTTEISPRQVAYIPGAMFGMKFPGIFDLVSWQEAQIQRAIRKANLAEARAQLSSGAPEVRATPIARTGSGVEQYLQRMSPTQVPEAMSREVTGMGKGKGEAWDLMRQNIEAAKKAQGLERTWTLQGENVPLEARRSAQFLLPPGTIEPPAAKSALPQKPSMVEGVKNVGRKALGALETVSNVPVIRGALHGANILGTGVQALQDVANEDPVGLGITAAQATTGLGGPIGAAAGIGLGELARYLRRNPEVILDLLENKQGLSPMPPATAPIDYDAYAELIRRRQNPIR